MHYLSGMCSDIGISRSINQDAALVRKAVIGKESVLFAVVCDGMGGLEKGELASATVITGMSEWFEKVFPGLFYASHKNIYHISERVEYLPAYSKTTAMEKDTMGKMIRDSWNYVISKLNQKIYIYGTQHGIQLGTTLTALLVMENTYYICNVGDSRIYYLNHEIRQITKDQTLVQQKVDQGEITEQEARYSDQRNVLLQCIGACNQVIPDYDFGKCKKESAFLLCSDGFRHEIDQGEMWQMLRPDHLQKESDMEHKLEILASLAKDRGEKDNITAVLVYMI